MVSKDNNFKYCSKCGLKLISISKFCNECGNNSFYNTLEEYKDAKENKYCINCGNKVSVNSKFCPSCGGNKFAQTKDEITNNWKEKINDMKNKISSVKEEIITLEKEVIKLEKEYRTIINNHNEYSDEIKKLNKVKLDLIDKITKLNK